MQQLFSYWSGPISWMERLSVQSARAVGHDVTVYSYEPKELASAGLGCRIADAHSIMERARVAQMPLSHFSDVFRVEGLALGLGTWFDLDIVFLRPLPDESYLFGCMNERKICGALLRLPVDCPMLAEYVDSCRRSKGRDSPDWYPWYRRAHRHAKGMVRQWLGGKPALPMYGPRTLTHLVHKHGLAHLAKPPAVFYPVASDHRQIAEMMEWPARYIKPETVCVHLWRSSWQHCHGAAIPPWAGHQKNSITTHTPPAPTAPA